MCKQSFSAAISVVCTTLATLDTTLKAGGVCLAPSTAACPKACKQSSDCNTKQGELCCDGLCSDSCPQQCSVSSDCSGQICCKTRAARSKLASPARQLGFPGGTGSSVSCIPGEQSVPRSAGDPCPQPGTTCAAGFVSTCQPDGTWGLTCQCLSGGSVSGASGIGGRSAGGAGGASGTGGTASVASCISATTARAVSSVCALCVCAQDPTAASRCAKDANCWGLIDCAETVCRAERMSSDQSMLTSCLVSKCASVVAGGTAATGLVTTVETMCLNQCYPMLVGTDAGD